MIHSFLMIGQSNMAGRGDMNEAPQWTNDRVTVMRNGMWREFYRPINPDRSFSGVSLAESFADLYSKDHDVTIGLIPCADGGTRIDQWKEGSLLYDNAVNTAKLAQRTSHIVGILWHQGEADCTRELYPVYKQKLKAMFNALRRDLGLYDVPIIMGELGYFLGREKGAWELENYPYINEQLSQIANEEKNIGLVTAEGLSCKADELHFDTKSALEFGRRYYEVFRTLEDRTKVYEEKPLMDDAVRNTMELL